jgi:protein TonB
MRVRLAIAAMLAGLAATSPAKGQDQVVGGSPYLVPPRPAYPVEALRDGIEGRCHVTLTVDAEGIPQDVTASCTHPVFDSAAIAAARAMRFNMAAGLVKPGEKLILPLDFRIGI